MNVALDQIDALPTLRPFPRLHQMTPGRLFHPVNDSSHVFALLSHDQLGVMDGTKIWCVVVAVRDNTPSHAGSLVALPRDAQVEPLLVDRPMRLVAVA